MLRLRPLPVADEGSNKKSVAVKICRRSKAKQILGTALRNAAPPIMTNVLSQKARYDNEGLSKIASFPP